MSKPLARALVIALALVLFPAVTPLSAKSTHPPAHPDVVPAGWPRILSIPKMGVRANVEAVSFTTIKSAEAPYRWGDVAWSTGTPRPGEEGRSQIYGHLDSYCCPAVFYMLRTLTPGDRFTIQYGSGKSLTFQVRWNRQYPDNGLPTSFMYAATSERGLLLITCAGIFHRDGTGYDHRDIVYATLVLPGNIAPPSLQNPLGVAVNARGDVYVADTGNSRIAAFDPQRHALAHWGVPGSQPGQFSGLSGIAVGPGGNVYAADSDNHRIQIFSPRGTLLARWGPDGTVKANLQSPSGVAVDGQGNVYVTDSDTGQVVKFSPSGQELARWGHTGHKLGEFWYPDSVAVGPNGAIYVADTANGRIQKLAPDGTPLLAWKIKGKHGHVFPPEGIAVDRSGNVFVVSPRYNHILRYSSSGKLTAKWGKTGSTLGRFRQLNGVTVDSRGDVYVADTLNDRVQEFSPRGTPLRLWW